MSDQTDPIQPNAIQGLAQPANTDMSAPTPEPQPMPVVPVPVAPPEMSVEQPPVNTNEVPPAPIMDQFSASGTVQPLTNMPSTPTKKHTNILVLLLLLVGVVLVAAGVAYYFVVMKKAPVEEQPVAQEPAPVAPAETPTPPEPSKPVVPAEVAQDPLIQQMETGIKSQSMNQIEKDLDALDYEGIDAEVKTDQF